MFPSVTPQHEGMPNDDNDNAPPHHSPAQNISNLVRNCSSDTLTPLLSSASQQLAASLDGNASSSVAGFNGTFNCTEVVLLRNNSAADVNRQLYCGFGAVRERYTVWWSSATRGLPPNKCFNVQGQSITHVSPQDAGCGYSTPQQYAQAWDFQTTSNGAYNVSMYYNNSDLPYENQQPFRLQRVNAVRLQTGLCQGGAAVCKVAPRLAAHVLC